METKIEQKIATDEGLTVRLKHPQRENQQIVYKGVMGKNAAKQQTESNQEIKLAEQCGITGTLHHALLFLG